MMMLNLIKKELWQRRWTIAVYCIIGIAFLWLYIGIYPSIQKQAEDFNRMLENYPKALMEAFNIESLQFTTLQGYIAVEHFSFLWPLLALLLGLSLSVSSITGEIEHKTMAILLSLPMTRLRLIVAKYLSALAVMATFTSASVVTITPLAALYNFNVPIDDVLRTALLSLVFGCAAISLGFAVASFASEKSKAYFILGGALLCMYVANIVAGLVSSLSFIRYGSLFNYYEPARVLSGSPPNGQHIGILLAFALAAALLGFWQFIRRDIHV